MFVDLNDAGKGTAGYETLNTPPPSTLIRTSNGNTYLTNQAGIVDEVTFTPRLTAGSRDARQTAVGKLGLDTDVGGHIQACSLGGTCDRVNLFPQDANFNNSGYKRFENELRNALEAQASGGPSVGEVRVRFVRPTPSTPRPTRVDIQYTIGGEARTKSFPNRSGKGG